MFAVYDKNGNGKIEVKELATMIRALGHPLTPAEAATMVKDADKNGNGVIDFNEFVKVVEANRPGPKQTADELMEAFRTFDKDGNGSISLVELKQHLTSLGDPMTVEEVEAMFKGADTNHDGKVCYSEFVNVMLA